MQVTQEQIDPCKIALTITVEPEMVAQARERAFQQAARALQLPGFRKGKVPPHLAKGYIDPGRVSQRAAEMLVPDAYNEALQEAQIQPWAQAEFELQEMNEDGALVFKALVPLRPVVTLGPYKGLAVERRRLLVTDADIDRQIEQIRERLAEYPQITDRAVQSGDVIMVELQATVEGKELPDLAQPRATAIEVGKNIPEFDAGLVGMLLGERKTIEALYPDTFDDESMRGKTGVFQVAVQEIRAKVLPEVNDELAKRAHLTAKTVEELREAIRENLERVAKEMAENELEFNLIGQIVRTSQIHFPDILLRAEMQEDARQLQERLERDRISLEDYLEASAKTREQLQQEMTSSATQRILNSLVLSEVARRESIAAEEADIDAKIAERAAQMNSSPAAVRALAEKNDQLERFRDLALTEKILAFLKEAATVAETTITSAEAQAEEGAPAQAGESAPLPTPDVPKRRRAKKEEAAAEEQSAEAPEQSAGRRKKTQTAGP